MENLPTYQTEIYSYISPYLSPHERLNLRLVERSSQQHLSQKDFRDIRLNILYKRYLNNFSQPIGFWSFVSYLRLKYNNIPTSQEIKNEINNQNFIRSFFLQLNFYSLTNIMGLHLLKVFRMGNVPTQDQKFQDMWDVYKKLIYVTIWSGKESFDKFISSHFFHVYQGSRSLFSQDDLFDNWYRYYGTSHLYFDYMSTKIWTNFIHPFSIFNLQEEISDNLYRLTLDSLKQVIRSWLELSNYNIPDIHAPNSLEKRSIIHNIFKDLSSYIESRSCYLPDYNKTIEISFKTFVEYIRANNIYL